MVDHMQSLALILAIIAFANVFASILVIRNAALSPNQRIAQLAIVWFVPLLGAVFCGAFAAQAGARGTRTSTVDPLYLPSDGGAPVDPGGDLCGSEAADGDGGGD